MELDANSAFQTNGFLTVILYYIELRGASILQFMKWFLTPMVTEVTLVMYA